MSTSPESAPEAPQVLPLVGAEALTIPDAEAIASADTLLTGLEPDDLDGHTIDELSDYLDRDRTPFDASIESSAGSRIALDAMVRLRTVSRSLLETDASAEREPDESWISGILGSIALESRAGREIPVQHPSPSARLSVTEGAVRGLIRSAGDSVPGVLIGRCQLQGDVAVGGEPITVAVEVAVFWGEPILAAAARVREAIYADLLRHTELNVVSIDVTVHDIHFVRSSEERSVNGAGAAAPIDGGSVTGITSTVGENNVE